MANNKSILILRGTSGSNPTGMTTYTILDGQPFYSKYNKLLYIGDDGTNDSTGGEKPISSILPVGASNIVPVNNLNSFRLLSADRVEGSTLKNTAAFGEGTKATSDNLTVVGQYNSNTTEVTNALFVVGSGESNSDRFNALEISKNLSIIKTSTSSIELLTNELPSGQTNAAASINLSGASQLTFKTNEQSEIKLPAGLKINDAIFNRENSVTNIETNGTISAGANMFATHNMIAGGNMSIVHTNTNGTSECLVKIGKNVSGLSTRTNNGDILLNREDSPEYTTKISAGFMDIYSGGTDNIAKIRLGYDDQSKSVMRVNNGRIVCRSASMSGNYWTISNSIIIGDGAYTVEDEHGNTTYTALIYTEGNIKTDGQLNAKSVYANERITAKEFYANSDKRLKENITPYSCEKNILDLPIYKFDFINGPKNLVGCLAQDLQEICPEIVNEGSDGYLSIEESKIVYLLLEEVKKLKSTVEVLKSKLD